MCSINTITTHSLFDFVSTTNLSTSMSTIEGPVTQVRSTAPRYTAAMTIRGKVADAGLADDLELNTRYFRSWPGLLKLLQLVLAIVALCCISPPLTVMSHTLRAKV